MATFTDGSSVPDIAFLRENSTLAVLQARLPKIRNVFRRARVADVLWEFSGDAAAARVAADAYLEIGSTTMRSGEEHEPFHAAGSLFRAHALAAMLNDEDRRAHTRAVIADEVAWLADRDDHVAFVTLVEALLEGPRTPEDAAAVASALTRHLEHIRALPAGDHFHFEQTTVALLERIARTEKNEERARAFAVEIGETMLREAEWKRANYPNGELVGGSLLEAAARYFERIGERSRAANIRGRSKEALGRAKLGRISQEVEVDLTPYRSWLTKLLEKYDRTAFWKGWLLGLPLPTRADVAIAERELRDASPLLSFLSTSTLSDDLIEETVPADEATQRRAEMFTYTQIRLQIRAMIGVAGADHQLKAIEAEAPLSSVGRLDATGVELLRRVLQAYDAEDWITVAYLSAPVIEKLVRSIATEAGIPVRSPERVGRPRLMYRSVEDLLRETPIAEVVSSFALYVSAHPGMNLRNRVGHAYLDAGTCDAFLGTTILYLLCALSFVGLRGSTSEEDPG
jgi:hypothetical protein